MSPGPLRPLRLSTGTLGLLLAVLALISQLALGSMVLPDSQEQSVTAFDALNILCSTGTPAAPGDHPAHHHAPDCTLCPLCVTLAISGAILSTTPALPAPPSAVIRRADLPPPARGPPSQGRIVPPARGPPTLT